MDMQNNADENPSENPPENPYQSPVEPEAALAEVVAEEPRPWGFWATAGFSAVVMFAFVVIQTMVVVAFILGKQMLHPSVPFEAAAAAEVGSSGLCLATGTIVGWIPCFGLMLLFVWLRRGWSMNEYFAIGPVSWRSMLLWLGILALFLVASETLAHFLDRPAASEFMVHVYQTAGFLPLLWFAIIVVAPVFEELFFRGFMFRGLAASPLGNIGAILITSLIWAVIHLQYDVYNIVLIFNVGILLGIARVYTKSVTTTIVLHGAMNLAAMIQMAWYLNWPLT